MTPFILTFLAIYLALIGYIVYLEWRYDKLREDHEKLTFALEDARRDRDTALYYNELRRAFDEFENDVVGQSGLAN